MKLLLQATEKNRITAFGITNSMSSRRLESCMSGIVMHVRNIIMHVRNRNLDHCRHLNTFVGGEFFWVNMLISWWKIPRVYGTRKFMISVPPGSTLIHVKRRTAPWWLSTALLNTAHKCTAYSEHTHTHKIKSITTEKIRFLNRYFSVTATK
jgi:hypothetical protein